MLTLSLFRHTKSTWNDPGLSDLDRPLAPRGEKAAPIMGAYMRSIELAPGRVFCSPALRAVQTARLALSQLQDIPEMVFDKRLYHADSEDLFAIIHQAPSEASSIMIIGHNPGLHVFALDLVGESRTDLIAALAGKFPTGALAVFSFEAEGWPEIEARQATLKIFMTPKQLPPRHKAQ